MIDILIVLAIILSLALIVLVTIQPRQNQLFPWMPLVILVNQATGRATPWSRCSLYW